LAKAAAANGEPDRGRHHGGDGSGGDHGRDGGRGGADQHPLAPPAANVPDLSTRMIALSAITVPPNRLRALRLEKVDELVESMRLPAGRVGM
jgi:hypothetical protein